MSLLLVKCPAFKRFRFWARMKRGRCMHVPLYVRTIHMYKNESYGCV